MPKYPPTPPTTSKSSHHNSQLQFFSNKVTIQRRPGGSNAGCKKYPVIDNMLIIPEHWQYARSTSGVRGVYPTTSTSLGKRWSSKIVMNEPGKNPSNLPLKAIDLGTYFLIEDASRIYEKMLKLRETRNFVFDESELKKLNSYKERIEEKEQKKIEKKQRGIPIQTDKFMFLNDAPDEFLTEFQFAPERSSPHSKPNSNKSQSHSTNKTKIMDKNSFLQVQLTKEQFRSGMKRILDKTNVSNLQNKSGQMGTVILLESPSGSEPPITDKVIEDFFTSNKSEGFRGVVKYGTEFKASIKVNNKDNHLGYFQTALEASIVYRNAFVNKYLTLIESGGCDSRNLQMSGGWSNSQRGWSNSQDDQRRLHVDTHGDTHGRSRSSTRQKQQQQQKLKQQKQQQKLKQQKQKLKQQKQKQKQKNSTTTRKRRRDGDSDAAYFEGVKKFRKESRALVGALEDVVDRGFKSNLEDDEVLFDEKVKQLYGRISKLQESVERNGRGGKGARTGAKDTDEMEQFSPKNVHQRA